MFVKKIKKSQKKSKTEGKSYYRFEIKSSKLPKKNKDLEMYDEVVYTNLLKVRNVSDIYHLYDNLSSYSNLLLDYSSGDPRWYDYSRCLSWLYDNYKVNFYSKGKFEIESNEYINSVSILEDYLRQYVKNTIKLKRVSNDKIGKVCRWFCYGVYRTKSLGKVVGTYTRTKANYNKELSDISYSYTIYLMDMIKDLGLAICLKGYNFDNLSRVNSCIVINPRLLDILEVKGDFDEHFIGKSMGKPDTFVKVRYVDESGRKIDMKKDSMESSDIHVLDIVEDILDKANELFNNTMISVMGIPIPEIWFTRIYKNTIYEYGRLFDNGEIQTKTKYYRSLIEIDGMKTVTLDIKSLHPRMIMEMKGIKAPENYDPYLSSGFAIDEKLIQKFKKFYKIEEYNPIRNLSKISLLCLINADSEESALKAIREKLHKDYLRKGTRNEDQLLYLGLPKDVMSDQFLKDWICKLKEHNHYISDWLGKGKSGKLQNLDGEIMLKCVEKLTKLGIVGLPVHDAIICAAPQKDIVEGVIREAYKFVLGTDFNLIIEEE